MATAKPYIGDDGEVRELDGTFAKVAMRGRPPMLGSERKVRMNFMIDPDLAATLDKQPNKSALVNEALRKALNSPPISRISRSRSSCRAVLF